MRATSDTPPDPTLAARMKLQQRSVAERQTAIRSRLVRELRNRTRARRPTTVRPALAYSLGRKQKLNSGLCVISGSGLHPTRSNIEGSNESFDFASNSTCLANTLACALRRSLPTQGSVRVQRGSVTTSSPTPLPPWPTPSLMLYTSLYSCLLSPTLCLFFNVPYPIPDLQSFQHISSRAWTLL